MISLREINSSNLVEVLKLKVSFFDRRFICSNKESIKDYNKLLKKNIKVLIRAIYLENTPIGFILLKHENDYFLDRLMLDKKYQNKGYGSRALSLALALAREGVLGDGNKLYLSCHPKNKRALGFYFKNGFSDSNRLLDGEELLYIDIY